MWATGETERLPCEGYDLLADATNQVYCSEASLWEIVNIAALRRADFRVDLTALRSALPEMGIEELPVPGGHTEKLIGLPTIHKDPFDRMLIAQCLAEPLILLTNDTILSRYSDHVRLLG